MATKEDNIKQLQALAVVLGRDADISGSVMEIRQRVTEWTEEAAADGTADIALTPPSGSAVSEVPVERASHAGDEWIAVRAIHTLHMEALTPEGSPVHDVVRAGTCVQIPAKNFSELENAGLVSAI